VVSSNGGALPEVVGHDGDGIIVPAKDSKALARSVKRLLDSPHLRKSMGERGHRRVMEMFTWRKMTEGTVEVYKEAIERKRHAYR